MKIGETEYPLARVDREAALLTATGCSATELAEMLARPAVAGPAALGRVLAPLLDVDQGTLGAAIADADVEQVRRDTVALLTADTDVALALPAPHAAVEDV